MACGLYLLVFTVLIRVSCQAFGAAETTCIEITENKSYSCEGLGLREIPEKLPATTEILEFSFNMLPSLQNSTFSELKSLIYLDLTRCQINWVYDGAFHSNKQLKTIVLTGTIAVVLAVLSCGTMFIQGAFYFQQNYQRI